ncbi:MAG: hypothetical protein NT018_08895 [Armatimonadetes bacterium]|nr:hypothetical protein [Armatimonadota bacterium]
MEAVRAIVEHVALESENVVLVTYYEVCNYYPDFFERVFGAGFGCRRMKRGEALIIDSDKGDCELLESECFVVSWNGVTGDGFERIKC